MSEASEILLQAGAYRAIVAPFGAALRQFWLETPDGRRELAWGYSGKANKKGGQGDVLIPFPGRIANASYRFEGRALALEKNDKEGPNAIHGFVRARGWSARSSDSAATFRIRLEKKEFESRGYPFTLEIAVAYALSDQGLSCELSIQNVGDDPAPVGAGFHPYFTVQTPAIDEAELQMPARDVIEFNDQLLPTGRVLRVEEANLDFRSLRRLGPLRLNHCFKGFNRDTQGLAQLVLRNPTDNHELRLWMDSGFDYLVAYTGDALGPDARKALALEPMSCATDAFNRPEWGLRILEPGQYFTARWGVAGA